MNNVNSNENFRQSKVQLSEQKSKEIRQLFPLKPYEIQIEISERIYTSLQKEITKFMIVQSPTGTGKSFSLLVPVLNWLSYNRFKLMKKNEYKNGDSMEFQKPKVKIPSFLMKKQNPESKQSKLKKLKTQHINNLSKIVDIEQVIKSKGFKKQNNKQGQKQKLLTEQVFSQNVGIEETYFQNQKDIKIQNNSKRQVSKQQKFMQNQMNLQKKDIPVKLIFVSRTHSQLEQIVKSVQLINKKIRVDRPEAEQLLSLVLGSKQLLCCNPQIKKVNQNKNNQSVSQKCQFLLNNSTCSYSHSFKINQFFGKPLEEVKKLSQTYKLCGYYGLKNSIDCADIIFLPYSSLVNAEIRTKIGININNSIIIFDQGHNLLDFIKGSSSVQIFYWEIQVLRNKTIAYIGIQFIYYRYLYVMNQRNMDKKQRYKAKVYLPILSRFQILFQIQWKSSPKNCMKFQQFSQQDSTQSYLKLTTLQLVLQLNLTEIKLHRIKQLFTLFDYDKKIVFFDSEPKVKVRRQNTSNFEINQRQITTGSISKIINWIQSIYSTRTQQKIVVIVKKNIQIQKNYYNNQKQNKSQSINISIKLFCLFSNQIQKIIDSSRLTIVAGGTMEPLSDFQPILNKINHQIIKVGHIISPEQCKINIIKKYKGEQIKFNHANLTFQKSIYFLTSVIRQTLSKIVSSSSSEQGIIVFIQSYKLIPEIKKALESQIFFPTILFDSQNKSTSQESIFEIHSQRINKKQSSIIISVMGGKLSEGINFSDNLVRKLLVFGLPYPNIKAPQIVEQMKYYDQQKLPNFNGQLYYESLCLKTINQTIGRAIRHKNDWANVYLIDQRFNSIKDKLSEWMRKSIQIVQNLQDL